MYKGCAFSPIGNLSQTILCIALRPSDRKPILGPNTTDVRFTCRNWQILCALSPSSV